MCRTLAFTSRLITSDGSMSCAGRRLSSSSTCSITRSSNVTITSKGSKLSWKRSGARLTSMLRCTMRSSPLRVYSSESLRARSSKICVAGQPQCSACVCMLACTYACMHVFAGGDHVFPMHVYASMHRGARALACCAFACVYVCMPPAPATQRTYVFIRGPKLVYVRLLLAGSG